MCALKIQTQTQDKYKQAEHTVFFPPTLRLDVQTDTPSFGGPEGSQAQGGNLLLQIPTHIRFF